MSRRRIILNLHTVLIGLVIISTSPLVGMEEEHHEEYHEEHHDLPETAHTAPTSAPATAPASGKLAWEDQPGVEKASGEGMTNINEARGNWFFKQQIGKDARKLEERINKKAMAIIPLQEKYINDHAKVDEAFNKFNIEYGFQGGDIEARLEILLEDIAKLEQTESAHDPEEIVLLEELKKKKAEVDALKTDFEYLQKLDNALSKGLSDMSSQITKAISYEDQATTHYEAIYDVLNDQVAEELFKKMQVLFDNITAIETYLTVDFSNFFKSTSQKITEQIEAVKQHIENLKKEGIALGQKMRDLQAKEDEESRLKEAQEHEKQTKIKEKANRTILSPIFDAINWVLVSIRDSIGWVFSKIGNGFSWIFGSKAKIPAAEKPEVPHAPPVPEIVEEPEEEPTVLPTAQATAPAPVVGQPVVPSVPSATQSPIQQLPPVPVIKEELPAAPISTTPVVSAPIVEPVPGVTTPVAPTVAAPADDHPYVPRAVTTEPYVPEVHPEVHAEEHHEEQEHAPELSHP